MRPIRMLFDIFRYYGRLECLVAIESLRNQLPRTFTIPYLLESSEHLSGSRGIREFRELIAFSVDTSQSPLETVARDILLRIPEVTSLRAQVRISYLGEYGEPRTAFVDFLINEFVAVELDGRVKYNGTYGDPLTIMIDERFREKKIQQQGKLVLRFGWREVMNGEFEAEIRAFLRAFN
ncbi:hypothetical protein [Corynebacterium aquatimens]|uniref:Uncharacterized protein n=1 Tax=Corynebacterium aquatimens TaxID=1190508 RepID=A0A931GSA0_9CORY|nr:hypothetical protein [Corynebacterium aquatimens]MBG6122833.1 hypothetical protein [Corynebacterium aquatimens]